MERAPQAIESARSPHGVLVANAVHGGQSKTRAQAEQQSAEPWGGSSADRRPACATINASPSNSTGLRNESSTVDASEAEASVDARV